MRYKPARKYYSETSPYDRRQLNESIKFCEIPQTRQVQINEHSCSSEQKWRPTRKLLSPEPINLTQTAKERATLIAKRKRDPNLEKSNDELCHSYRKVQYFHIHHDL